MVRKKIGLKNWIPAFAGMTIVAEIAAHRFVMLAMTKEGLYESEC